MEEWCKQNAHKAVKSQRSKYRIKFSKVHMYSLGNTVMWGLQIIPFKISILKYIIVNLTWNEPDGGNPNMVQESTPSPISKPEQHLSKSWKGNSNRKKIFFGSSDMCTHDIKLRILYPRIKQRHINHYEKLQHPKQSTEMSWTEPNWIPILIVNNNNAAQRHD